MGDLLRHPGNFALAIAPPHPEQDEQAGTDPTDDFTVDGNRSLEDALEDGSQV
jgi:hypothetical protein